MRLLLGMILGRRTDRRRRLRVRHGHQAEPPGADARPMVNWDVVGRNFNSLTGMVKHGWNKLTK